MKGSSVTTTENALVQEQKAPEHSERVSVWNLIIQDMHDRNAQGTAKYGTPLQAFNGRDALVDAYQECLDLCVYLRQKIEEDKEQATWTVPIPRKARCVVTTESKFKRGDRVTLNAYAMSLTAKPHTKVGTVVSAHSRRNPEDVYLIWDGNISRSCCRAELLTIEG